VASRLTYDGITLDLIRTDGILRENVYDSAGIDVIYVRWLFDVVAVWNPDVVSYKPGGSMSATAPKGVKTPTEEAASVIDSDRVLRWRLMQPRKKLLFQVDSNLDNGQRETLLESPQSAELAGGGDEATVDCKGGPIPRECNVTRLVGASAMIVQYKVETYVDEAPAYFSLSERKRVIQSHLWTMSTQVDEQFFTTREVSGEAIMRTDGLELHEIKADALRRELFHPIPTGFQRRDIQVTANPDGSGVAYAYRDVECPSYFLAHGSGATQISGTHRISLVQDENLLGAMANFANQVNQFEGNRKWAWGGDNTGPSYKRGPTGPMGPGARRRRKARGVP
jgi:hypothetical protein